MDIDAPRELQDMSMMANRLSLINRYNCSLGIPGPSVEVVQREFIDGFMDPLKVPAFVAQCELIIESRWPMQSPAEAAPSNPRPPFSIPKAI